MGFGLKTGFRIIIVLSDNEDERKCMYCLATYCQSKRLFTRVMLSDLIQGLS